MSSVTAEELKSAKGGALVSLLTVRPPIAESPARAHRSPFASAPLGGSGPPVLCRRKMVFSKHLRFLRSLCLCARGPA